MVNSILTADAVLDADASKIVWWRERPVWVMLFLGFSASIPLWLVFSTLSVWLREAGVERSTVTYFSWAVLGYSFKFVWAPLVDKLPIPFLTRIFGRRRGWMLLSQFAVIAGIVTMAMTDPSSSLRFMALAAVLLGFSSATQDIVIDAYRIESAKPRLQAMLASTYIAGYRVGQIVAVAGGLTIAEWLGSTPESYSYSAWQTAYLILAAMMSVGVLTTLCISEPESVVSEHTYPTVDYLKFFTIFLISIAVLVLVFTVTTTPVLFEGNAQKVFGFLFGTLQLVLALVCAWSVAKIANLMGLINQKMVYQNYQEPIGDFFSRYGKIAIWVLVLIGFYRITDIVQGVIAYVFYIDIGYTKAEIASVTKVFGIIITIAGSFLGGMLTLRFGVMRVLMFSAIIVSLTNLVFVWLANSEAEIWRLIVAIVIDNLAQGISLAVFVAWLSSLTNVSFTATQYAIFSSIMTLFPKLIGGYSGTIVDAIGYSNFFIFASALGLPVIALIHFLSKRLEFDTQKVT